MRKRNNTAKKPRQTAVAEKWLDITYERAIGDEIGKRRPRGAVPALARLGMMVQSELGEGVVVAMTPQHCIIAYEDGKEDALRWGEVEIEYVVPDPAQLPPPRTP
jgi:hypothetical protein